MADITIVTYGEGGFDAAKPNNNIIETVVQPVDGDGNPDGPPVVAAT